MFSAVATPSLIAPLKDPLKSELRNPYGEPRKGSLPLEFPGPALCCRGSCPRPARSDSWSSEKRGSVKGSITVPIRDLGV